MESSKPSNPTPTRPEGGKRTWALASQALPPLGGGLEKRCRTTTGCQLSQLRAVSSAYFHHQGEARGMEQVTQNLDEIFSYVVLDCPSGFAWLARRQFTML